MEAAAWHQLGRAYHEQRQSDEAERHYREAARISEERGHLAAAAQTWNQLAVLAEEAGKPEDAEGWYRKALEVDRRLGNPKRLGHCLNSARRACCRTNRVASSTRDTWPRKRSPSHSSLDARGGGGLEALRHPRGHHRQRGAHARGRRTARSALEMQARDYRELQRHAPIVSATLARVGESPSYGRAVILGQLARCFHMGGRPDLAVRHDREAVGITATLAPSDGVKSLAWHVAFGSGGRASRHRSGRRRQGGT